MGAVSGGRDHNDSAYFLKAHVGRHVSNVRLPVNAATVIFRNPADFHSVSSGNCGHGVVGHKSALRAEAFSTRGADLDAESTASLSTSTLAVGVIGNDPTSG